MLSKIFRANASPSLQTNGEAGFMYTLSPNEASLFVEQPVWDLDSCGRLNIAKKAIPSYTLLCSTIQIHMQIKIQMQIEIVIRTFVAVLALQKKSILSNPLFCLNIV